MDKYYNEITKVLDEYTRGQKLYPNIKNYITNFEPECGIWIFRYVGGTRGAIHVDEDRIIKGFKINSYLYHYTIPKEELEEILNKKFVGTKLELKD